MSATRIMIIRSLFNEMVTSALLNGAQRVLSQAGTETVDVTEVDGCFELPVIASHAAQSGNYDAVIALGCVIRGETPHFDIVAESCANGLMNVSTQTGIPVSFGVLTTDTVEQALNRCGLKGGNKGAEAAQTALNTLHTIRLIKRV
jgi:6,7-dimethyl-8-ribityllumazine synthase